jgi:hypothetical protein
MRVRHWGFSVSPFTASEEPRLNSTASYRFSPISNTPIVALIVGMGWLCRFRPTVPQVTRGAVVFGSVDNTGAEGRSCPVAAL